MYLVESIRDVNIGYFGGAKHYGKYCLLTNISTSSSYWSQYGIPTYNIAVPNFSTVSAWSSSKKNQTAKKIYIADYYNTRLSKYTPEQHLKLLCDFINSYRKAAKHIGHSGDEPIVICCYEKPGEFCHRLIYSIFLEMTMGICIGEKDFVIPEDNKNVQYIRKVLEILIRGGASI